ncbi:helix-turn-helix domain-containing protein [Solilutibacter silvestris]|uniref:Helix-turn-helix protein n=1 Tax=Solilutibacter silvestris TaxID=1645665 RepID=A0A2K1Q480_9GAMM|nr:helix-turn-helix domain-containing protein [Lysobacter silvestris]PNS09823.1 helix-turn-helix protein [Lysobacter silvestris]
MSNLLMGQVFQLDLEPSIKLVLMGLADAADDRGGSCFPAVATIARKASISERQAQRNLKLLREAGWCYIESHKNGGRCTRRYRLNVGKLREKSDDAMRGDKLSSLKASNERRHERHPSGDVSGTAAVTCAPPELPAELSVKITTRDLVWPQALEEGQVVVVERLISEQELDDQQQLLDELAGALASTNQPRRLASWMRALVGRVQGGTFVPDLGLAVATARARRAQEKAEQQQRMEERRREEERRNAPEVRARSEESRKNAMNEISKQLRRNNDN